jgi:predicted ester cyclase
LSVSAVWSSRSTTLALPWSSSKRRGLLLTNDDVVACRLWFDCTPTGMFFGLIRGPVLDL